MLFTHMEVFNRACSEHSDASRNSKKCIQSNGRLKDFPNLEGFKNVKERKKNSRVCTM